MPSQSPKLFDLPAKGYSPTSSRLWKRRTGASLLSKPSFASAYQTSPTFPESQPHRLPQQRPDCRLTPSRGHHVILMASILRHPRYSVAPLAISTQAAKYCRHTSSPASRRSCASLESKVQIRSAADIRHRKSSAPSPRNWVSTKPTMMTSVRRRPLLHGRHTSWLCKWWTCSSRPTRCGRSSDASTS